MKLDRRKKETFVDDLARRLGEAQCVVLTDFTGLDVERLTQLRSKLRASAVDYVVVKNTLARRAIAGTPAAALEELLQGASAFALGRADVVAAARVLTDFSKETSLPRIKGGLVGDRFLGVAEIQRLATLPGREVLLSRVLGSLQSPVSGFVFVLAGILAKFVRTVDAVRAQRVAAGEGTEAAAGESAAGESVTAESGVGEGSGAAEGAGPVSAPTGAEVESGTGEGG